MKRTLGLIGSVAIGVIALSAPVAAHHSFAAAYNMQDAITVEGTIVDVRLTNPHSFFFLDVEDENGDVVRWSFEAGTPGGMIRNGFSTDVIKEGAVVTISGFRAKDPTLPNGMLRQLTTADGTVYGMFGPQEGPGAR
jgi:DNA/RNA endonuclease YhcR with UshA esterase domain